MIGELILSMFQTSILNGSFLLFLSGLIVRAIRYSSFTNYLICSDKVRKSVKRDERVCVCVCMFKGGNAELT